MLKLFLSVVNIVCLHLLLYCFIKILIDEAIFLSYLDQQVLEDIRGKSKDTLLLLVFRLRQQLLNHFHRVICIYSTRIFDVGFIKLLITGISSYLLINSKKCAFSSLYRIPFFDGSRAGIGIIDFICNYLMKNPFSLAAAKKRLCRN